MRVRPSSVAKVRRRRGAFWGSIRGIWGYVAQCGQPGTPPPLAADTEAPRFTCPANQRANTTLNAPTAPVSWPVPAAVDNVSPAQGGPALSPRHVAVTQRWCPFCPKWTR